MPRTTESSRLPVPLVPLVPPTNESSKFVGDYGNIIPIQSGFHKTPKYQRFNIPGQAHELTFSCMKEEKCESRWITFTRIQSEGDLVFWEEWYCEICLDSFNSYWSPTNFEDSFVGGTRLNQYTSYDSHPLSPDRAIKTKPILVPRTTESSRLPVHQMINPIYLRKKNVNIATPRVIINEITIVARMTLLSIPILSITAEAF